MGSLSVVMGLGIVGGLAWLAYRRLARLTSTVEVPVPASVKPGKTPVKPPTYSELDPAYPETGSYITDPENAIQHPSGLVEVLGKRWTAHPYIDRTTGLNARLTWTGAAKVLARDGLRFIRPDEWQELYASGKGFYTEPCTLVHQASDQNKMRSLGFAKKHDDCLAHQLKEWDGKTVIINAGKQWSPTPGNNYGWLQRGKGGRPIQGDAGAHAAEKDRYTDYSQLLQGIAP